MPAMALLTASAVAALVATIVVAVFGLSEWLIVASVASVPLYALGLRKYAEVRRARWEACVRDGPGTDVPPPGPLLDWYYAPDRLRKTTADRLFAAGQRARASRMYLEAFDRALAHDQPIIANDAFESMRGLPSSERTRFDEMIRHAMTGPQPSFLVRRAFADMLIHEGDLDQGEKVLQAGLTVTADRGERFTAFCRLAELSVAAGRFGAARGYLREARDVLPADDRGYAAMLERTEGAVDAATRQARAGDGLVQLGPVRPVGPVRGISPPGPIIGTDGDD